jgi:hypothetical protein
VDSSPSHPNSGLPRSHRCTQTRQRRCWLPNDQSRSLRYPLRRRGNPSGTPHPLGCVCEVSQPRWYKYPQAAPRQDGPASSILARILCGRGSLSRRSTPSLSGLTISSLCQAWRLDGLAHIAPDLLGAALSPPGNLPWPLRSKGTSPTWNGLWNSRSLHLCASWRTRTRLSACWSTLVFSL